MKTTKYLRGTFSRFAAITTLLCAMAGINTVQAASTNDKGPPQDGVPDSKLIGCVAVSTDDVPGTWWRLIKDRFDELGVTDYEAALEVCFGQSFDNLDDAIAYMIDGLAAWDTNGNGMVCAYEMRGTRAYLGESALYLFGVADDKFATR